MFQGTCLNANQIVILLCALLGGHFGDTFTPMCRRCRAPIRPNGKGDRSRFSVVAGIENDASNPATTPPVRLFHRGVLAFGPVCAHISTSSLVSASSGFGNGFPSGSPRTVDGAGQRTHPMQAQPPFSGVSHQRRKRGGYISIKRFISSMGRNVGTSILGRAISRRACHAAISLAGGRALA